MVGRFSGGSLQRQWLMQGINPVSRRRVSHRSSVTPGSVVPHNAAIFKDILNPMDMQVFERGKIGTRSVCGDRPGLHPTVSVHDTIANARSGYRAIVDPLGKPRSRANTICIYLPATV
jgi:hypothetical protein